MSTKPGIDLVKWVGIAAAILVFLGGQAYVRKLQVERHNAEVARADEEAAKAAEYARTHPTPVPTPSIGGPTPSPSVTPSPTDTPSPTQAPKDPPVPQPIVPKDPTATPPVHIVGEHLDLEFSPTGAGISRALLHDYRTKAGVEDEGLEMLGPLDPAKISLALTEFKFGTQVFDDLETRVWAKLDGKDDFEGSGDDRVCTIKYELVLHEPAAPYRPLCKLTKIFKVNYDARHVDFELQVQNLSTVAATYDYTLRGPAGIYIDGPADNPKQGAYVAIKAAMAGRKLKDDEPETTFCYADAVTAASTNKTPLPSISFEENLWVAVNSRFFTAIVVPRDPRIVIKINMDALKAKYDANDQRTRENNLTPLLERQPSEKLEPNATSKSDSYALYLGPIQHTLLQEYEERLAPQKPIYLTLALQYCDIFSWRWPNVDRIARFLLWVFNGIYGLLGNYGIAVIFLTIFVKLCLHPFQRKMTVSMYKMQELAPKLAEIEKKYEGQTKPEVRQKKEMEKLDLMRKAGANPAMGCLPMLLQMPIFFALYGSFNHAFEIRQAHFLWIKDLSISDHLATLSFWPHQFNLLPLLYSALSIYQMLKQPAPPNADDAQKFQRKMMIGMTCFFGVILYNMPSGLVLYFASSTLFGLVESWYVKKYIIKAPPPGTKPTSPLPEVKAAKT